MCIVYSVGEGGKNKPADCKMIQVLLNENLLQLTPLPRLEVDGMGGPAMVAMIKEFQARVMQDKNPDGRVDPHGHTISALHKGITTLLTADKMLAIMSTVTPALINQYFKLILAMMASDEAQINTPKRMAHYLAQVGVETGDLQYTEENASGDAYEGLDVLGNTEPGDGARFKGRGLLQMTGRWNYTAYGKSRGKDYTTGTNSSLVATDDFVAVDSSGWYWHLRHGNRYADSDNVREVTLKVNGGLNGFAERKAHLQRAKCLLVR